MPDDMLEKFYINARDLISSGYYDTTPKRSKKIIKINSSVKRGVIGEIKPRSPSSGKFFIDINEVKERYCNSSLNAISVLTEPNYFGGDIRNLDLFSGCNKPLLMKDFIIDKRQILSGYEHNADLILVIIKLTRKYNIVEKELISYAHELNLQVVVEVNNMNELNYAKGLEADFIGINSRNLDDLSVDKSKYELIEHLHGFKSIAMSSIETTEEIVELWERGFQMVLIGSAFMRNPIFFKEVENLHGQS